MRSKIFNIFAGTCNVIFVIVILVYNILCDLISIVLQNIHIVCGRFLTCFLFQRISTQVLSNREDLANPFIIQKYFFHVYRVHGTQNDRLELTVSTQKSVLKNMHRVPRYWPKGLKICRFGLVA